MGNVPNPTVAVGVAGDACPECLLGNLNWLLSQAHFSLATKLATAFEPLGISPRGHSVLAAAMSGSHSQKQLADLVGLDKTTMVAALDELERAGLARRAPSSIDRRAYVVEVTPAGRRKVTAANRVALRVQSDVLGSLQAGGTEFLATLAQLVTGRLAEPSACNGIRRREPGPRAAA